MGYLVDSNVFIDYVSERFSGNQLDSLDAIFDDGFDVSIMTKIEILGFNMSSEEEHRMIDFLDYANVIHLTDDIVMPPYRSENLLRSKHLMPLLPPLR